MFTQKALKRNSGKYPALVEFNMNIDMLIDIDIFLLPIINRRGQSNQDAEHLERAGSTFDKRTTVSDSDILTYH